MFGKDEKLIPRTYSIKSYRCRRKLKLGKLVVSFFYFLAILLIVGITVMASTGLI